MLDNNYPTRFCCVSPYRCTCLHCLFYSVHDQRCRYDAEADDERARDDEDATVNDIVHDDDEADNDDSDTGESIHYRG